MDECDKGSCPALKAFFLVVVLITTVWKQHPRPHQKDAAVQTLTGDELHPVVCLVRDERYRTREAIELLAVCLVLNL